MGILLHSLPPLDNLLKLVYDERVQCSKHYDWSKSEEDLTADQVGLEDDGLTDVFIFLRLP